MNHHEPSWTIHQCMFTIPKWVWFFLIHISSCFSQLTNYAVAGARCCPPKRLRRLRFHHSSGAHSSCLSTKHPAGRRLSCGDAEEPWKKSSAIPSGNHNHYIIKQGNGIALYPSFWFICLMKLKFCRLSAVFFFTTDSQCGWLRNPAPVGRWFMPLYSHYLQCFIVTSYQ